jgi:uncharacterized membrane protein
MQQQILQLIAIISVAGILFSGYLSYKELCGPTCKTGCSTTKILNIPPCVYGLVMYTIVFILALIGITSTV